MQLPYMAVRFDRRVHRERVVACEIAGFTLFHSFAESSRCYTTSQSCLDHELIT